MDVSVKDSLTRRQARSALTAQTRPVLRLRLRATFGGADWRATPAIATSRSLCTQRTMLLRAEIPGVVPPRAFWSSARPPGSAATSRRPHWSSCITSPAWPGARPVRARGRACRAHHWIFYGHALARLRGRGAGTAHGGRPLPHQGAPGPDGPRRHRYGVARTGSPGQPAGIAQPRAFQCGNTRCDRSDGHPAVPGLRRPVRA